MVTTFYSIYCSPQHQSSKLQLFVQPAATNIHQIARQADLRWLVPHELNEPTQRKKKMSFEFRVEI